MIDRFSTPLLCLKALFSIRFRKREERICTKIKVDFVFSARIKVSCGAFRRRLGNARLKYT